MPLVNCPECSSQISDKAINCPQCGYPLENLKEEEKLICPTFPKDMNIGKQIVNWKSDAALTGTFEKGENVVEGLVSGKASILLCTHGVMLLTDGGMANRIEIHASQIISLLKSNTTALGQVNRSVMGRAAVGALILGPLGAIIGGLSGVGSKEKIVDKNYLVINYWDVPTKKPQTILVSGKGLFISKFMKRYEKEKNINITMGRQAEKRKGCLGVFLFLLIPLSYFFLTYFFSGGSFSLS